MEGGSIAASCDVCCAVTNKETPRHPHRLCHKCCRQQLHHNGQPIPHRVCPAKTRVADAPLRGRGPGPGGRAQRPPTYARARRLWCAQWWVMEGMIVVIVKQLCGCCPPTTIAAYDGGAPRRLQTLHTSAVVLAKPCVATSCRRHSAVLLLQEKREAAHTSTCWNPARRLPPDAGASPSWARTAKAATGAPPSGPLKLLATFSWRCHEGFGFGRLGAI